MKRKLLITTVLVLFLLQVVPVLALTVSEARQDWLDAKQVRVSAAAEHNQAKLDYAVDKTPENQQRVIDTAKDLFDVVLDEVEAWLVWKEVEAETDPRVPQDIKDDIAADVATNLAKIADLRIEVDGIENQFQVGVVFLKMIGSYIELLADVARNTGAMWAYIGDSILDVADGYEAKLRQAADQLSNNSEIIAKLDLAQSDLAEARGNVDKAEVAYGLVKLPGTPLIKFAEGNDYLRVAKTNLTSAQAQLVQAFNLIISQ